MFPEKIMIVEDELITSRYLKGIVSKMGITVQSMHDNGDSLLEALKSELPDMILMDINIKGKRDGLELTSLIEEHHDIPVIFITAYSDGETLSKAMNLSPYGYIVKPFTEVDVEIAVKLASHRYYEKYPNGRALQQRYVKLSMHCRYDLKEKTLHVDDEEIVLNAKQSQLLQLLIKYRNLSVSQEVIEHSLWPNSIPAESSVRTLVYSIRKLVLEIIIETHSKIGYILRTID